VTAAGAITVPGPGRSAAAARPAPAAGGAGGDGVASAPGVGVEVAGAWLGDEVGAWAGDPTGAASGAWLSGGPVYEPGIIEYPPGPPGTGKSSHSSQKVAHPTPPVASATASTASRSLAMTLSLPCKLSGPMRDGICPCSMGLFVTYSKTSQPSCWRGYSHLNRCKNHRPVLPRTMSPTRLLARPHQCMQQTPMRLRSDSTLRELNNALIGLIDMLRSCSKLLKAACDHDRSHEAQTLRSDSP
jgi:hypothetical protein